MVLDTFKRGFPTSSTKGSGVKILIPQQMLQRWPIALAHVKVGNTSENLQLYIFCIKEKILIKKYITVYGQQYNTDTILNLWSSWNISNFSDKSNLKWSDKYFALSNLSIYYIWKNIKNNIKTTNLKHLLQYGMINLNCLID